MKQWQWLILPSALVLVGCSLDTAEVKTKTTGQGNDLVIDYDKQGDAQADTASATPKTQATQPVNQTSPSKDMHGKKTYAAAPAMQINKSKQYSAVLKTALGDITIKLHTDETPITVNNFVFLAKEKFYDNVIFHRTIPGFMIQGGDPTGTGMGGPGYRFNDEPFTGEYKRGIVAMANAGPDTNGSQFFIMHADAGLPKNYVIFGEVTSGMEVVDKIATAPTEPGGEGSKPVTPIEIRTVEVTEE
jgi:cyclophilin family peptidyl-prolyl cis-trans isomerase